MQIWMAWALAFFLCIATPAQAMSASKALANPLATKLDTHYFPINHTDPDGLLPVNIYVDDDLYDKIDRDIVAEVGNNHFQTARVFKKSVGPVNPGWDEKNQQLNIVINSKDEVVVRGERLYANSNQDGTVDLSINALNRASQKSSATRTKEETFTNVLTNTINHETWQHMSGFLIKSATHMTGGDFYERQGYLESGFSHDVLNNVPRILSPDNVYWKKERRQ